MAPADDLVFLAGVPIGERWLIKDATVWSNNVDPGHVEVVGLMAVELVRCEIVSSDPLSLVPVHEQGHWVLDAGDGLYGVQEGNSAEGGLHIWLSGVVFVL